MFDTYDTNESPEATQELIEALQAELAMADYRENDHRQVHKILSTQSHERQPRNTSEVHHNGNQG